MSNVEFHFGIEVNDYDWLWIHGSWNARCFKWVLRRFWRVEVWTVDDWHMPPHVDGQAQP